MAQENFIPVRIVGSDSAGNEEWIGDFPGGVVLKGTAIQDTRNGQIIATLTAIRVKGNLSPDQLFWDVPRMRKKFAYMFLQVMPQDAPTTVTIEGKQKRFF